MPEKTFNESPDQLKTSPHLKTSAGQYVAMAGDTSRNMMASLNMIPPSTGSMFDRLQVAEENYLGNKRQFKRLLFRSRYWRGVHRNPESRFINLNGMLTH